MNRRPPACYILGLAAVAVAACGGRSSGGSPTPSTLTAQPTLQSTLLDLGHVQPISLLRLTSTRVLSLDQSKSWILWDYATAGKLTGALAACWSFDCGADSLPPVDLEGPTLVDETAAGLEVRASLDGSVLAVITTPVTWWKLATDGSYVCAGSASALTVWSPTGAVIFSRAGDYSTAAVFPAPGQVQIALGPAGLSVVETVTLPSGATTITPPFQGTFNSWFQDGQHFLSHTGNTVWTYTNTGVQADITALPTVENLTGQGSWFWTYAASTPGNQVPVSIYNVGASGSPTATYSVGAGSHVIPSGLTLALLQGGVGSGAETVVDLSGSSPATTSFTSPIAYASTYAATSASQWLVGNNSGVLLDGTSIAASPRYFGYGQVWSIAGSGPRMAIATASGAILYFNSATNAQEGTIHFLASQLALSADGSVLVAAADQSQDDRSINIYSLPSGTRTYSWPYSYTQFTQGGSLPFEVTLSASGTALGQVLGSFNAGWNCSRQVTAVTGGPALWSDTFSAPPALPCGETPGSVPVRLSPDGTKVAVSNNLSPTSVTTIYSNGTLVNSVPGWVVGWLDDSRILVNTYALSKVGTPEYAGSTIYSSTGTKLGAPPLPELQSLQVVSAGSIYDPWSNAIYSTTTGMATWSSTPSLGAGAVAGSEVVFASGSRVLVQPF